MDTTINQQVAIDEDLVPHAKRLRIKRSNFCLLSDIKSKESTIQLEFWETATVHDYAIRFKMDNKKDIVNLESFRDIIHIYPRVSSQSFAEPPFEEEILAFIRFLRHSAAIRKLTDVNINKLYQPWRSFTAIIDKSNTKILRRAMRCIILDSRRLSFTTSCQRILRFQGGTRSSDTTITPPTAAAGPRLTTYGKGKQEAKATKAKSLSALSE
nr:hypothetical protein [Tanacetum cinerariifolium]